MYVSQKIEAKAEGFVAGKVKVDAMMNSYFIKFFSISFLFLFCSLSSADEHSLDRLTLEEIEKRMGRFYQEQVLPNDRYKGNLFFEPLLVEESEVYELSSNSASRKVLIFFYVGALNHKILADYKAQVQKHPELNIVLAFTVDSKGRPVEWLAQEYLKSWEQIEDLVELKFKIIGQEQLESASN